MNHRSQLPSFFVCKQKQKAWTAGGFCAWDHLFILSLNVPFLIVWVVAICALQSHSGSLYTCTVLPSWRRKCTSGAVFIMISMIYHYRSSEGSKQDAVAVGKDEAFEKIPPVLISSVPVPVLKQSPPKLSHLFLLFAANPAILKRIGWHIIQVQE